MICKIGTLISYEIRRENEMGEGRSELTKIARGKLFQLLMKDRANIELL